jgi:hypothetical protein
MGFPWGDPHQLFHPETLHQCHQGLDKRIVKILLRTLTTAQLERVNEQVLRTPPFPGQAIPSEGLLASGVTAHKANCMLQRLGAAVLTLAHNGSLEEELKNWLQALISAPACSVAGLPCSVSSLNLA